jgi:hypothetical protein
MDAMAGESPQNRKWALVTKSLLLAPAKKWGVPNFMEGHAGLRESVCVRIVVASPCWGECVRQGVGRAKRNNVGY